MEGIDMLRDYNLAKAGSTGKTVMLLLAIALLAVTSGCAYNAGYNSTYLPPAETRELLPGEVMIYMPAADAQWVYTGHPTSFTGSATTLSMPLGSITQQIAVRAFSQRFSSVQTCDELPGKSGYLVAVQPRVQRFEYAYSQLKNLGFAITPQVWVDLHVHATAPDGKVILDKVYASDLCEGETYVMSGSPSEKVNKETHQVLWSLMTQAVTDIETNLK
jgi:hypothetical protein